MNFTSKVCSFASNEENHLKHETIPKTLRNTGTRSSFIALSNISLDFKLTLKISLSGNHVNIKTYSKFIRFNLRMDDDISIRFGCLILCNRIRGEVFRWRIEVLEFELCILLDDNFMKWSILIVSDCKDRWFLPMWNESNIEFIDGTKGIRNGTIQIPLSLKLK